MFFTIYCNIINIAINFKTKKLMQNFHKKNPQSQIPLIASGLGTINKQLKAKAYSKIIRSTIYLLPAVILRR